MIKKLNLEKNRNTKENIDYYKGMENLISSRDIDINEIVFNFPVFA